MQDYKRMFYNIQKHKNNTAINGNYKMFINRKTQYLEHIKLFSIMYKFNVTPIKIPVRIFKEQNKLTHKSIDMYNRARTAKVILKNDKYHDFLPVKCQNILL